jgi:hypothetical protein
MKRELGETGYVKYMVPARRQGTSKGAPVFSTSSATIGKCIAKIIPTDKVEPQFRTPSQFLTIGSIKIPIRF